MIRRRRNRIFHSSIWSPPIPAPAPDPAPPPFLPPHPSPSSSHPPSFRSIPHPTIATQVFQSCDYSPKNRKVALQIPDIPSHEEISSHAARLFPHSVSQNPSFESRACHILSPPSVSDWVHRALNMQKRPSHTVPIGNLTFVNSSHSSTPCFPHHGSTVRIDSL